MDSTKVSRTYRTLRTIDGKDYIELAEHEEIVSGFVNFEEALQKVNSVVLGMSDTAQKIKDTIKDLT